MRPCQDGKRAFSEEIGAGGEIRCLEPDGRTHFNKLLFRREWPFFYAFDVLSIEDEGAAIPPRHGCTRPVVGHLTKLAQVCFCNEGWICEARPDHG
jgi:hypothetical protein